MGHGESPAYSDPAIIDNPQSTDERFVIQQRNGRQEQVQDGRLVLARWPQHDNPLVIARRIVADVTKPKVKRDEASSFASNDHTEFWIRRSGQFLIVDRVRIMAGIA